MLIPNTRRVVACMIMVLIATVFPGCNKKSSVLPPSQAEVTQPPAGDASPSSNESAGVFLAADAHLDDGTRFVSWDADSVIPFLIPTEGLLGQVDYLLGLWNVGSGTVAISESPLFSVSEACRVFWDGSDCFVLIEPEDCSTTVTVRDERLSVHLIGLKSSRNCVVADLAGTQAIAYRDTRERAVLEIRDGSTTRKVLLAPPGMPPGTSLLGPVAVRAGSDANAEVYLETFNGDRSGTITCSLLEASWDGQSVSWRLVCPDMGLNEAGAGARKAKSGDTLVLSDYRIRLLDLETGKIAPLPVVDDARTAFGREYVRVAEYRAPAEIGSYGGFLVVQWNIPAVDESKEAADRRIPTAYLAVVCGDAIVGEIKSVDGRTWSVKDGQETQEIVSFPGDWIFPQEH